jgi:hypothetical protein
MSTALEPADTRMMGIDELAAVLFPHLDREVEEAMPVVSASITHAISAQRAAGRR